MTVKKIITAWTDLPNTCRANGVVWYAQAHKTAREIARSSRQPLDRVVGVIARLSPACEWSHNLDVAREVCHGREPEFYQGYGQNLERAREVLVSGWTPAPYGPKINAFYDNILCPDRSEAVTLDRHILRWMDERISIPRSKYERWSEPWRKAAEILSLRPHQVQAAVWLSVREEELTV